MIYTFYSFKGGVGRSMVLANIAQFYYSKGARVLMVDWDLEAPGLESFFFGADDPGLQEVRSKVGLIDYLEQYRQIYDSLGAGANFEAAYSDLLPLDKFLFPVYAPTAGSSSGELWLLPAGWRASRKRAEEKAPAFDDRFPKYAAAVQDFNWNEFYVKYSGAQFFESFRALLTSSVNGAAPKFDVVLIDSRTGVTEVGGVCTRQLADVVVSFCAPNTQNLQGAERMAESFSAPKVLEARKEQAGRERALEVLVIPARVDEAGETEAQNQFRGRFLRTIATPAALKESVVSTWDLRIPYITKYAYSEALAVDRADSNETLEKAYKNLATHLVLMAPSESLLRARFSAEINDLRRSRPRVLILAGLEDDGFASALKTRLHGVEFAASIGEASSLVVCFRNAPLSPTVKVAIRDARQRGITVYGLAAQAVSATDVPMVLRQSSLSLNPADVSEIEQQLRALRVTLRAPFAAPPLNPAWISRPAELAKLKSLLLNSSGLPVQATVALQGPVGSGMTVLATQLCHDESVLDAFVDGILWAQLGGAGDVLGCLRAIGTALSSEPAKFESISEALARLGQQLAGRSCLLIVDGLMREEDFRPFRALPVASLVTTSPAVSLRDVHTVALDRMSHAEAMVILTGSFLTTYQEQSPQLSRLAFRLEHWPLALAMARMSLIQMTRSNLALDEAAARLSEQLEHGNFNALGANGPSLLELARGRIAAALRTLPESDRAIFGELKAFVNSPSFPADSFPARWTLGEERFRSVVSGFESRGLLALNPANKTIELSAFTSFYLRELTSLPESRLSVFLVRPFGVKDGIDFDVVQRSLVDPALREIGVYSISTGSLVEAGRVREDLLSRLVSADLVIADISVHNAGVFYQLGMRHSLRDKRTLLIRCAGTADVPFDLKTDRLLTYDANAPNATVNLLIGSLQSMIASEVADSPVFLAMPQLAPVSASRLQVIPASFRADLDDAEKTSAIANLRLFGREVAGLPWELEGLRLIARAQFRRASTLGAVETWESVLRFDSKDIEAHLALGTLYQRLGDVDASNRSLQAVLASPDLSAGGAAEALALLGSNCKKRWVAEWINSPERTAAALHSRFLAESLVRYSEALTRDLNSYYAALNALALLTIRSELARLLPDRWLDGFQTEEEAHAVLARNERQKAQMAALVEVALRHAEQIEVDEPWIRFSQADLMLYTDARSSRVAAAYQRALEGAHPFAVDSARRQLAILADLGVLQERVAAALSVFPPPAQTTAGAAPEALLFVGHTLDDPTRSTGRFPPASEPNVRLAIANALKNLAAENRPMRALAGGSAGGDILFHELCLDLGISATLCLPYPPSEYVLSSVQYAGSEWVGRFYGILKRLDPNVLVLAGSAQIPAWLSDKPHYSVWQRNMQWMIAGSQEIGNGNVRLMALWDDVNREGYGGVSDFVNQAKALGVPTHIVPLKPLVSQATAWT